MTKFEKFSKMVAVSCAVATFLLLIVGVPVFAAHHENENRFNENISNALKVKDFTYKLVERRTDKERTENSSFALSEDLKNNKTYMFLYNLLKTNVSIGNHKVYKVTADGKEYLVEMTHNEEIISTKSVN